MAIVLLLLAVVAIVLAWWLRHRAVRWRRETEDREAQVLEAIFAARAAEGAAKVDLDRVFGGKSKPEDPTRDDAVLRAAKLAAAIAPAVDTPTRPAATTLPRPAVTEARIDSRTADDRVVAVVGLSAQIDPAESDAAPARVRDLVRVFYEARGYRSTSAEVSARPIELLLVHKADSKRAYAFAALRAAPSASELAAISAAAQRIGQARVLVTTEAELAADAPAAPAGVKVYDRAVIGAQLAQIDPAIADRILAAARRRSFGRKSPA
jgi:hypothetical protein